jgi:methionyl-tRNA formyltransferase
MKVVFFGTPQFAIPCLQALLQDQNFQVVTVVTQPDKRRARGTAIIPSPVKQLAQEHHIPIWQPQRCKTDSEFAQYLQTIKADVFVVVAYGQILPISLLTIPKLGCINVHGSILPQYRGAAPIQWSIYNGDEQTGITTMLMDEGMDTGAMLLKSYLSIGVLDNAQQIGERLAQQGADLLKQTLLELGTIKPIAQDATLATYAPLIKKTDYLLDWHKSALQLHNQIRAFYPDCYSSFRENPLKIVTTVPAEYIQDLLEPTQGSAGEIVYLLKNQGPIIQTGDGLLLLKQVQIAGKKIQSGWDFVNGMRISTGEKLG